MGARAQFAVIDRVRTRWASTLALLLCAALLGCPRAESGFRVSSVAPDDARGPLELNAPITISFDREVDPSSVSLDSIVIESAGRRASGRFEVEGARVRFVPKPVATADLGDGGYLPGATLTISLEGFPARSGVLDRAGRPLAQSFRTTRRVVSVDAEPQAQFIDVLPGKPPVVENSSALHVEPAARVSPQGFVRLAFSEPLAPRSVTSAAIDLRFDNRERTAVAAEIRFSQGETTSEIWVRPVGGFQRDTKYLLGLVEAALTDLVGTPAESMHPITVLGAEDGVDLLGAEQESDRE